MTYHEWGDAWFNKNGKDLAAAENYIYNYVKKYSFCTLISKEKYGTIRYEYIFPPYGGCYIQPNWIDKFLSIFGKREIKSPFIKEKFEVQRYMWHATFVYKWWRQFGIRVLRRAIKSAIKKYPNIKREIVADFRGFT